MTTRVVFQLCLPRGCLLLRDDIAEDNAASITNNVSEAFRKDATYGANQYEKVY